MLYKIDYTTRNELQTGTQWVNHVADSTDATKRFMDKFFSNRPNDAVRIDLITEVEMTGDLSQADVIDGALNDNN